MTIEHKCSAKTPDMYGIPNIHPCRRSATVECDGKWYCWQHDPEYIAKRAVKRRADWEAKMDREAAKYARIARNARLGALITEKEAALLLTLAGDSESWAQDNNSYSEEAVQARTLAARIREALALEANDEAQ